ncbi:hypothetical protein HY415_01365 [Candidatus Kaiserbacteria bacterium]|nr:hypothetical protein [Candidatus Kaiserbacteria bacterium]
MWERAPSTPRDSLPGQGARLAERRRSRRRRGLIAFIALLLLLFAAALYGLWQNSVRISNIIIYGEDPSLAKYAEEAMQGSYFGIIPRDSTFFFPASRIRADILATRPDIAAVSIFRNGFTGISIKPSERVPIARWCGLSPTVGVEEYCYVLDASGHVFAAASTTTETVNTFALYAPLVGDTLEPPAVSPVEPLRATVAHANRLPTVFDFARQLDTLGSPVTRVVIREDEVDDYLASETRVTYILGRENDAFTALVSARDNFNLADGSIEYIDLRFDGKVYLKRK